MTPEKNGDRTILHCDCNSFFASVETALNPDYRGVPMAVCGSSEDRHGIVLAKNELAKAYGIVTAETVYSARKKCPALVVASPHYKAYTEFSRRVGAIYADYTDLIEPFGIDESWLDVTASRHLFGDGRQIADAIRERVKAEIGITVSVGVSFNKIFAKFGSDYKKPDAVTEITRENYREIVWPHPVGALLFVGKKTEKALSDMGVRTVGDLARLPREALAARLGASGGLLWDYANGLDQSPVSTEREEAKSVSNGLTFRRDLSAAEEMETAIGYLCEEIGTRLRRKGLEAGTVALSIKDPRLVTISRRKGLARRTDLSAEIASAAVDILHACWTDGKPVRSLTVAAQNLSKKGGEPEQFSLFDSVDRPDDTGEKIEIMTDKIRQRFGQEAIQKADVIGTDFGLYEIKRE